MRSAAEKTLQAEQGERDWGVRPRLAAELNKVTFEQRGKRSLGASHLEKSIPGRETWSLLKVTSARSRGFFGGQERHGSCSSRKLWPECLMLPRLGEGSGGGMRWGLRMALMADLGPQGQVRMGCFLHTKACTVHWVHREGAPDVSLAFIGGKTPAAYTAFHPDGPICHVHLTLCVPRSPVYLLPPGSSPGTGKPAKVVSRTPDCLAEAGKAEAQIKNHLISGFWKDPRLHLSSLSPSSSFLMQLKPFSVSEVSGVGGGRGCLYGSRFPESEIQTHCGLLKNTNRVTIAS